jgi:hypothetical protein
MSDMNERFTMLGKSKLSILPMTFVTYLSVCSLYFRREVRAGRGRGGAAAHLLRVSPEHRVLDLRATRGAELRGEV